MELSMDDAIERLGLRPRGHKVSCPLHSDSDPSLHLYRDHYFCHACGDNGDAYGLVALFTGRHVNDVLAELKPDDPLATLRAFARSSRPAGSNLHSTYRTAHNYFFDLLRPRLRGYPAWLVLRTVDYYSDAWDTARAELEGGAGSPHDRLTRFKKWAGSLDPSPVV
jgi:hypothetical protein